MPLPFISLAASVYSKISLILCRNGSLYCLSSMALDVPPSYDMSMRAAAGADDDEEEEEDRGQDVVDETVQGADLMWDAEIKARDATGAVVRVDSRQEYCVVYKGGDEPYGYVYR